MQSQISPRYPDLRVELHTRNPYALVSAVRSSLRRRGIARSEIHAFTSEALEGSRLERIPEVCSGWVRIVLRDD